MVSNYVLDPEKLLIHQPHRALSALTCSSRENSSGATALTLANLGCVCGTCRQG